MSVKNIEDVVIIDHLDNEDKTGFLLIIQPNAFWNSCNMMAHVIVAFMKQFRDKNNKGIPSMLFKDEDDFNDKETQEKRSKEFEDIIENIIKAFELINEVDDFMRSKEQLEIVEKGKADFAKYFETFWD